MRSKVKRFENMYNVLNTGIKPKGNWHFAAYDFKNKITESVIAISLKILYINHKHSYLFICMYVQVLQRTWSWFVTVFNFIQTQF